MSRFWENLTLDPDLGRGLRVAVALGAPLLIFHGLNLPADAMYVAIASQALAVPDLRGAYGMRLAILAALIVVVAASTLLGVCVGASLWATIAAMGLLALLGGGWRMLSEDYGPALSVNAALLFLMATAHPGTFGQGVHLAGLVALGGLGAAVLQIALWLVRPQHPLRYAVAECWVAVSDLVAGMRRNLASGQPRQEAMTGPEQQLRATLDRTFVILGSSEKRHRQTFIAHLEETRIEVVHFAMRLLALETSLEALVSQPRYAGLLPVIDSVCKTLGDAARSAGVTVIMHRRANLIATEMRLRRSADLLRVFDEQLALAPPGVELAEVRAALQPMVKVLERLPEPLARTIDLGSARASFSMMLPEISTRSIRSLAAWVNPPEQLDPVLARYALRMAVLTMLAVALYKGFQIPSGYWIAFSIVVVLQPDYGSTRQKAAQRIGGTFAGIVLGSALLWVKMPLLWLDGCASVAAFCFAYFLKRRYGVAVFFVTLMVVLMSEMTTAVHLSFTLTRLASNLMGGLMALVSAVVFWPVWEGEKFATLLAAAIRANRAYLAAIAAHLGPEGAEVNLLANKRRAENANRFAAASLQRMLAEPGEHPESDRRAAALATYNQRVTRAFSALALPLQEGAKDQFPEVVAALPEIGRTLEALSSAVEGQGGPAEMAQLEEQARHLGDRVFRQIATTTNRALSPADLALTHLTKAIAEIQAMTLALRE